MSKIETAGRLGGTGDVCAESENGTVLELLMAGAAGSSTRRYEPHFREATYERQAQGTTRTKHDILPATSRQVQHPNPRHYRHSELFYTSEQQ